MARRQKSVALPGHISGLEDPRRAGKVVVALNEIMLVALCDVLSGAESFDDIGRLVFDRAGAAPIVLWTAYFV